MNIEIKSALRHWLICKKDYKMFRKGECYTLSIPHSCPEDRNCLIVESRNAFGVFIDDFPTDEFFDIFAVSELIVRRDRFTSSETIEMSKGNYDLLLEKALKYEAAMCLCGYNNFKSEDLVSAVEGSEDFRNDPISKVFDYIAEANNYHGNTTTIFKNRCREHNIKTVGDLLHYQRINFKDIRLIGKKIIVLIDKALHELYGIESW